MLLCTRYVKPAELKAIHSNFGIEWPVGWGDRPCALKDESTGLNITEALLAQRKLG
jgi:hypothetical protein